jgi:hypothetical protein
MEIKIIQLEQDEHIIAIIRKHWFSVIIQLCVTGFLALVPLFGYPFLKPFLFPDITQQVFYILLYFYFVYLLFLWIIAFIQWTDYYLDMWILTNKRLVDIEQISLFHREVSSLRLEKIQDVKVHIQGFLDTMLKMGTVYVQTAGVEQEFRIPFADNPLLIKQIIMKAYTETAEKIKTVRIEQ